MNHEASGIMDSSVYETPFAVVDFETTGLTPGSDRVIEVSVVRIEPGGKQQIVLDTLINPQRPVAATEIHGITDDDVVHAPVFHEIVGDFVRALSGCVVAAYNVYFDIRFLIYELRKAGFDVIPPHLCLMYMRPMLGIGKRCTLQEACRLHGISDTVTHAASMDAKAASQLMGIYFDEMKKRDITTFGDLARLKHYKFVDSFIESPFVPSLVADCNRCEQLKSRYVHEHEPLVEETIVTYPTPPSSPNPIGEYWDALKTALADLRVTDAEILQLQQTKRSLRLQDEQVRMLHARVFAGVISQFVDDKWLDDRECRILHRIHSCLSQLGWAPGEYKSSQRDSSDNRHNKSAGVKMSAEQVGVPAGEGALAGKTIVVTGTLENYTRSEIKELIKNLGGRSASSVSKKTDFVLAGDDPGSKVDKAKTLDVKIVNEEEFGEMVGKKK